MRSSLFAFIDLYHTMPSHGPPTVKEIRKVARVTAAALSELGFTTCLFGSAAGSIYGMRRTPNASSADHCLARMTKKLTAEIPLSRTSTSSSSTRTPETTSKTSKPGWLRTTPVTSSSWWTPPTHDRVIKCCGTFSHPDVSGDGARLTCSCLGLWKYPSFHTPKSRIRTFLASLWCRSWR